MERWRLFLTSLGEILKIRNRNPLNNSQVVSTSPLPIPEKMKSPSTSTPEPMKPVPLQPEPLSPVTGEQGITIPELEGIGRLSPDAFAVAQVISGSLSRFADRLELLHAESALERIRAEEAADLRHDELLHSLHLASHFLIQGQALISSNESRRFPTEAASLRADGIASYAQCGVEPGFHEAMDEYSSNHKRLVTAREAEKSRLEGILASKRTSK